MVLHAPERRRFSYNLQELKDMRRQVQEEAEAVTPHPARALGMVRPARLREFDPTTRRKDRTAELAHQIATGKILDRRGHDAPTFRIDEGTGEVVLLDRPQVRPAPEAAPDLAALDLDVSAQDRRRFMYRLQARAGRLRPGERVSSCHRLPQDAAGVELRRAEGRSYLSGVQTCGSVWMCPICAAKITESRRSDLQQLLNFVRAGGGQLLMLTLTVPHARHDDLADMLTRLTAAYRSFVSGRGALSRVAPGYLGYVRALEVTHGNAHGWHPHLHVLVAVGSPLTDVQQLVLSDDLFARWNTAVQHHGFGALDRTHGLRLDVPRSAGDEDAVTGYVVKWGAAEELSKLHSKQARNPLSGSSPWALLHDAETDLHARALWRAYSLAFKGRRQLVWSRGLRDLAGLGVDVEDEDLAQAEPQAWQHVHTLTRREWLAVRVHGSRSELLDMADYGVPQVRAYLARMVGKLSPAEDVAFCVSRADADRAFDLGVSLGGGV